MPRNDHIFMCLSFLGKANRYECFKIRYNAFTKFKIKRIIGEAKYNIYFTKAQATIRSIKYTNYSLE